jgi:hypothetical protein
MIHTWAGQGLRQFRAVRISWFNLSMLGWVGISPPGSRGAPTIRLGTVCTGSWVHCSWDVGGPRGHNGLMLSLPTSGKGGTASRRVKHDQSQVGSWITAMFLGMGSRLVASVARGSNSQNIREHGHGNRREPRMRQHGTHSLFTGERGSVTGSPHPFAPSTRSSEEATSCWLNLNLLSQTLYAELSTSPMA